MGQVFIVNPKGGCGKTTIATQLSGYYASAGKSVTLVDHDAQKSSSDWLAARPDKSSPIIGRKASQLNSSTIDDSDIVIHDMPAAGDLNRLTPYLNPEDRLLVPVLASPTDIRACMRFVMSMYRDGLDDRHINVGFIANKVRVNTRYFAILNEFLTRLDLPFVGQVRDTQNYVRYMDRGLSVFDMPSARVKRDIEEWFLILDWLGMH